MLKIEILYPSKCKDCVFIRPITIGKAKRHICTNEKSERYNKHPYLSRVPLRGAACSKITIV